MDITTVKLDSARIDVRLEDWISLASGALYKLAKTAKSLAHKARKSRRLGGGDAVSTAEPTCPLCLLGRGERNIRIARSDKGAQRYTA